MKPFKNAFIVGRFQHIHIGHERMINAALSVAETVLVLVGSAQESGTERNPFTAEFRQTLIERVYSRECFDGKMIVDVLPDMTNENDICVEWGRYVLDHVRPYFKSGIDLMVYGNDENRAGWYDPKDIEKTSQLVISRGNIDISATKMRELIVKNDHMAWSRYVNAGLLSRFGIIQDELLKVPYYKELANNV